MSKLTTTRRLSLFFLAILLYTLLPLSLAHAAGAAIPTPISNSNFRLPFPPSPLPPGSPAALPALSSAMAITATKTYTIATDSDGDNQADPGDVLSYTIVISNDGGTTSTGVTLSDTLDANTNLSGLVSVSPVALDNSYNTATNPVVLTIADGSTDLFADDYPGQTPPVSGLSSFGGGSLGGGVTTNAPGSTVAGAGGAITVNANGSFVFTPSVGFQGVFSFSYRLQNPVGPSDGRVSLIVDAPPRISSTIPLSGATNVNASSNITITFSENVDVAAGGVTLGCPSAAGFAPALPLANVNPLILNPTLSLPGGVTCTVSLLSANITDSDTNDPPDNLDGDGDGLAGGNYVFTFGVAPEAVDDAYNTSPHLTLTITPTTGVRANDNPTSVTITGFGPTLATANGTVPNGTNSITTSDGGTVILNTDGSFTYNPPPDIKNSTDEFFYTVTGGDTAQVTLNIQNQNLIWFVDAGAAAGGNGTQARPFNLLTGAGSFAGASHNTGDFIFIADGTYTCGLTLLDNQTVVGDGSSSTLQAISGVTPVSGSSLPAFSGTDPTLNNPAGSCFTLASGNTVRGLTINDTTNGFALTSGTGSIGATTVSETSITGPGGLFNLTTGGTFNATFDTLSSTSAVTTVINMANTGGTISHLNSSSISHASALSATINIDGGAPNLTYNGNLTKSAGGQFINVEDTSGAAITLGGTLSQNNVGGSGIRAANNSGGTTLTFSGTSKILNLTTSTAISLTNNTGATINFTNGGLDIDTTTAPAVNISGGGTVNVNGAGNTIDSTSGAAFLNSGGSAVIDINAALTSTTGRLIDIQNRTANTLTLSGNLSNSGTGILAQNNTGGTINFSGSTKTLNTGTNTAVTLSTNTGATINFTNGGLDIDTSGTMTAFSATGGGTVTVQGSDNSISSGTGTALNIANTNIGTSGLTFRSISANGAANGIVLNNTGASNGLTVTGTGATDGSGGTIQNTGADGIILTNARFVNLSNMVIGDATAAPNQAADATNNIAGDGIAMTNADDVTLNNVKIARTGAHGIDGTGVTNLTITNSEILNAGDGNEENGLAFDDFTLPCPGSCTQNNLDGTVLIQNTIIDAFAEDGINVENFNGTLNMTVTGSTIGRNANTLCGGGRCGENGILARADGASVIHLTVTGSSFPNVDGNGIFFISEGTALTASTLNVSNTSIVNATAIGIVVFGGTGDQTSTIESRLNFLIGDPAANNTSITGNNATAISIQPNGKSTVRGTVQRVTINGSTIGRGIEVLNDDVATGVVSILNNIVSNTAFNGIFANSGDTSTLDIHIRNNNVSAPLDTIPASGLAVHGIEVNPLAEATTLCLDIAGNTSAGNAASGGAGYRTRQRDPDTFRMERLIDNDGTPNGVNTNAANVAAFVASQNVSGTGSATVGANGYTVVADGFCQDP